MPGPKRFNKDKRPKRNTQSLLFKRKRLGDRKSTRLNSSH